MSDETEIPHFIAETKDYTNHQGLHIQERIPVGDDTLPPQVARFCAFAEANMVVKGRGRMPVPVAAPIFADTIQEAYEQSEEALQQAADATKKRIESQLFQQQSMEGARQGQSLIQRP